MDLEVFGRVLGVELRVMADHHFSCRICVLSKKGKLLAIEETRLIEGPLVEVLNAIPKNLPSALTLTGKGILHKNLKTEQSLEASSVFPSAFPSSSQKDFYIQHTGTGTDLMVAIIRQEVVDELLAKLANAGVKLYMVSLAGMVGAHILPQLNVYDQNIEFDGHLFELNDGHQLTKYNATAHSNLEFQLKIGEQLIATDQVIAYASAFQLILNDKLDLIHAKVAEVDDKLVAFMAQTQLKKKGLFVLLGLFVVLLINFFLFSYYNDQNKQLGQTVSAQVANADQTALLTRNIAESEKLLKQLNWNSGYNYGFLTQEIGRSCPRALRLQDISFNDYKTTAEQLERKPTIKIIGFTSNLIAVNNWIFVLKKKDWFKTIKLIKYQQREEVEEFEFILMISY